MDRSMVESALSALGPGEGKARMLLIWIPQILVHDQLLMAQEVYIKQVTGIPRLFSVSHDGASVLF